MGAKISTHRKSRKDIFKSLPKRFFGIFKNVKKWKSKQSPVKVSVKISPSKNKNPIYHLGQAFGRLRATFLMGFYSVHVKIRYLHDKTYARGGGYKKWSDHKYSSALHKSVLVAFITSFIFFQGFQYFFPYFNMWNPNPAQAGANSKTWTTTEDFAGGVIDPSYLVVSGSGEGGYLRLNVDESLSSLDANIGTGAQGDVTINSSVNINTLVGGYNPGTGVVPNFRNLTITPTGTLTTSQGVPLEFRVSENLIVESGGKIDATGMGYQGGGLGTGGYMGMYEAQPGFGTGGGGRGFYGEYDYGGGGGGGYGSVGGLGGVLGWNDGGGAGGPAYSNFPAFGSGGGSSKGVFSNNIFGYGGAGGGIIKINAQNISLSGNILASGFAGNENNNTISGNGGGGSGGSVFIYTPNTLDNINNVIASGGAGGSSSRSCSSEGYGGGGGGAGGRIKIVSMIDGNTPNLSTTVRGGLGGIECITSRAGSGGTGTYNKIGIIKYGEASGYRVTVATPVKPSWSTISFNGNQDPNGESPTFIKFQTRGTNVTNPNESTPVNQVDPNNGWTTWQNVVGGNIQTQSTQTLEVKVILESNSGISTPALNDFTVTYDTLEYPGNSNLILTKTDGTSLKSNTGTTITGGVAGAWTNETSLRVTANNLTCGGGDSGQPACAVASTGLRPEVQASTATDFSNPITATAVAGNTYADLSGLSTGTPYHLRVRAIDNEGRVSGWTSYGGNESTADVTIDQTSPTGTVAINSGATFATSTSVTLTLSATDTGGSALSQMRFSNDGTTWSDWETYATTKAWTLAEGADGNRNVYVQFRDNAGNTNGVTQTTAAQFNDINPSGNIGAGIITANNDLRLFDGSYPNSTWYFKSPYTSPETGLSMTAPSNNSELWSGSNEIPGYTVRYNLNGGASWTIAGANPISIAVPTGGVSSLGIAIYGSDQSLSRNFSLPTNHKFSEGQNISLYIFAVGYDCDAGYSCVDLRTGNSTGYNTRVVGNVVNEMPATASYTSKIFGGSTNGFASMSWNELATGGSAVSFQIKAGPNADLSGGINWTTVTNNQEFSTITGWSGNFKYLQYKAILNSGTNQTITPYIYDVTIKSYVSASIILDMTPPANITNLRAYSDSGKGTEFNQTNWYTDPTPYYEWNAIVESGLVYRYCFGTDPNCAPSIDITQNNFTPPTQTTDGIKYLRIIARDLAGNNSVEIATFNYRLDQTVPGRVSGFGASNNDIDSINLSWNAFVSGGGSPLDHYKLERVKYSVYLNPDGDSQTNDRWNLSSDWSTGDGYASFTFTSAATPANPFEDSSIFQTQGQPLVETAIPYIYRIRAKDVSNANYSEPQQTEITGLTRDTISPTDPSNVQAVACDGTLDTCEATDSDDNPNTKGFSVYLNWGISTDTGTGVAKYSVYRSTSNEIATFVKIGEVNHPIISFYDNDGIHADPANQLNDYTTYYYRITATDNSENESAVLPAGADNIYKNHKYVTTPDVTPPSVPSNVTATAVGLDGSDPMIEGVGHQRIVLSWDPSVDRKARSAEVVPGTVTYHVYRSTTNYATTEQWLSDAVLITPSGTTGTNLNDDALLDLTLYYYRITATDERTNRSGLSQNTGRSSATTYSSDVPASPHNVRVNSLKGVPSTDPEIGHRITAEFQGSRSKSVQIVKYEVYRSTTNYESASDWLLWGSRLKLSEPATCGISCTSFTTGETGGDISITPIADDYDSTYRIIDSGLTDATTYYYRIRAQDNAEVPNQPEQSNRFGPLSAISPLTAGLSERQGWDITPDVTAPVAPAGGLEVRVRDTHPNNVELRNIITWVMLTGGDVPTRGGVSDFARYEVWREMRNPTNNELLLSSKIADKTSISDNLFTDTISLTGTTGAFYTKDLEMKYFVRIVDNAGTDFRYGNGTVINSYSNYSGGEYADASIIPSQTKPSLTSSVTLSKVEVTSATVSWTTDQEADSLVQFRKAGESSWKTIGQIERTKPHTVNLFGLEPNTTYEYQIVSRNYLGNNIQNVGTLPQLSTTGFNISPGTKNSTTTTAEISWTTNLDASSAFVEYQLQREPGDEPQSGTAGVSVEDLAAKPRDHKVVIKGLRSNRAYTYKIKSISKDNYLAEYPAGVGTNFESFRTKSFDSGQFTLAPSSSNVAERNITSTNAQIIWETAIPTTTWVDYGTKTGVYDVSAGNNDLVTKHVALIDGLIPGETYYYRVRVKDANEVEYTSQEYSFRAVLKPKISGLNISEITPYSVTISWETNIETETLINWGKTTAYGEKKGIAGRTKSHSLKVDNLEDNTEYHYQILARDETGEEVAADDNVVRTPLDTEGPKIEDVKIDILPLGEGDDFAQVIITWKTNKPATTLIQYDLGLVGGTYSKSSIEDLTLSTTHTVIVKELEVASTYHYRIVARDKRDNTTISNDYTFVTPEKNKSVWQLIVRSLEETFAWVKNIGNFFNNIGKKTE